MLIQGYAQGEYEVVAMIQMKNRIRCCNREEPRRYYHFVIRGLIWISKASYRTKNCEYGVCYWKNQAQLREVALDWCENGAKLFGGTLLTDPARGPPPPSLDQTQRQHWLPGRKHDRSNSQRSVRREVSITKLLVVGIRGSRTQWPANAGKDCELEKSREESEEAEIVLQLRE